MQSGMRFRISNVIFTDPLYLIRHQRMTHRDKSDSRLASLFERLTPRLLATGRRWLGSRDDASDALHDTFVKLWSRNEMPSEGVVMTAMRNTCIDALRRRRNTDSISDSIEQTDEESQDAMELYDEVNRLIMAVLSPRDREIMLMRDRDGYELDAIAARTGLTEANIRVILSRSRRAVRQIYLSKAKNPSSI